MEKKYIHYCVIVYLYKCIFPIFQPQTCVQEEYKDADEKLNQAEIKVYLLEEKIVEESGNVWGAANLSFVRALYYILSSDSVFPVFHFDSFQEIRFSFFFNLVTPQPFQVISLVIL